jgi:hypothetical protein
MKNKTTGTYQISKPEAWIAVSSNRQKIYGDKNVYLDNGQEFQIELYNPTNQPYLAKMYLNGNLISPSGLVLKPGQRYFLDRFIDEKKKLVFSTYEVDDDPEVKQAIANNGMIKVEFYPEQAPLNWCTITTTPCYPYHQTWRTSPNIWYSTNTGGLTFGSSTGTLNVSTGTVSTSSASFTSNTSNTFSTLRESKSLETGRVEQGSKSNQELINTYGNFSWIWTYSSEYQILPRSVKPVEVSEIRDYCTECGVRIKKKTWKFCPTCGEKLV